MFLLTLTWGGWGYTLKLQGMGGVVAWANCDVCQAFFGDSSHVISHQASPSA